MLKCDRFGPEQGFEIFGGSMDDFATGIDVCPYGRGYVACGNSLSGNGDSSAFLWKVSETEGTLWTKRLEGCIPWDGKNVMVTGSGGYAVAVNQVADMDTVSELAWIGSAVVKVATGEYHSLFLTTDSTLWACGFNVYGQLGDGTTTNRNIPVKIMTEMYSIAAGFGHNLIIKNDGSLWACGKNEGGHFGVGTTIERHTPVLISLPESQ